MTGNTRRLLAGIWVTLQGVPVQLDKDTLIRADDKTWEHIMARTPERHSMTLEEALREAARKGEEAKSFAGQERRVVLLLRDAAERLETLHARGQSIESALAGLRKQHSELNEAFSMALEKLLARHI